jgi:Flp pilus assembly protein TadG
VLRTILLPWRVVARIGVDFVRDRRATMHILLAAGILPLLAAVGLAVDGGLGFMLKNRMGKALDVAGIAAGRVVYSDYYATEAREFFDANFPANYLGAQVTHFAITPDADKEFITLDATASMPTRFMHIFNINSMTVSAHTVINRQNRGMELALVLDNTGSMSGSPMTTMKQAAHDLIQILYGSETTLPNMWVSIVPYVATVNIGTDHASWLAANDRVNTPGAYSSSQQFPVAAPWKGCVTARSAPHDTDDSLPSVEAFNSFFWASASDNTWPGYNENYTAGNSGHGPNLGCGPAILPLVQERATVDAKITEMQAWSRGGTTGNLGLAWGWRVLSPNWRGMWAPTTPADMPLDYNTPLMDKVVVIMTDGQNQFYDDPPAGPNGSDYTAYGRLTTFGYPTLAAARNEIDTRMAAQCAAMKAQGIIIYSITFGAAPDAQAQTLFRNCASNPGQYFYAPSQADLTAAFHSIGTALSNLRIAQ